MVEDHGTGRIAQQRIVAIGASSGGLQPLERVLSGLPADFPAAVFVVLHMGTSSHLAEILGRVSSLPVFSARTGEKIVPGHVYVAIPGLHVLIHDSHLLLRRGPRENYARPAIDPLFRSAACSFGSSVIGVVLSGALNDGTSGLRAIKRCGGTAVVQDPAEAAFPQHAYERPTQSRGRSYRNGVRTRSPFGEAHPAASRSFTTGPVRHPPGNSNCSTGVGGHDR